MTRILFLIVFSFLFANYLQAQTADEHIRKGNELYKQQKYGEAEKEYTNAIKLSPGNKTAVYNLAATKYRLNKPAEAKKEFEKLTEDDNEPETKSTAHYNTGAILSKEKRLEESIEAYKKSLRLNPSDKEARENLQKALLELKKKPPPEKKKEEKKKKQEPKKQPKPQSKLSQKEVEKQLQLLQQKEKEVKQRMQNEKVKEGVGGAKDW